MESEDVKPENIEATVEETETELSEPEESEEVSEEPEIEEELPVEPESKPAKKYAGQFETPEDMEKAYMRSQQELNEARRASPPQQPPMTYEQARDEYAKPYYAELLNKYQLLGVDVTDDDNRLAIANEARGAVDRELAMKKEIFELEHRLTYKTSPEYKKVSELEEKYKDELAGFDLETKKRFVSILEKETSNFRSKPKGDKETAEFQRSRAKTLTPGRDNSPRSPKGSANKGEYDYYKKTFGYTKDEVDAYKKRKAGR